MNVQMNLVQSPEAVRSPHMVPTPVSADALVPPKAVSFIDRFREIVSDPLNLLIERHPLAGTVDADQMVTTHCGLKVPYAGAGSYYEDFSQILVINRGVHEPLEEFVFQELIKKLPDNPSMLELGSYWSHYSMWMKLNRPGASNVMVEPDRNGLKAGIENFRRNRLEGDFLHAMVGDGAFRVDDYLKDKPKLNLLHSDIQGYEVQMLGGAAQSLDQRKIDYLCISTHSEALHREVLGRVESHGYRIEVESGITAHTTAMDGLVFASSPGAEALFGGFRSLGRSEIVTATPQVLVEFVSKALNRGPN